MSVRTSSAQNESRFRIREKKKNAFHGSDKIRRYCCSDFLEQKQSVSFTASDIYTRTKRTEHITQMGCWETTAQLQNEKGGNRCITAAAKAKVDAMRIR